MHANVTVSQKGKRLPETTETYNATIYGVYWQQYNKLYALSLGIFFSSFSFQFNRLSNHVFSFFFNCVHVLQVLHMNFVSLNKSYFHFRY